MKNLHDHLRQLWILPLFLVAACSGPLGPFSGGALGGEEHAGQVTDWSFAADLETIELETNPTDPHSVHTWIGVVDGIAYIPTSLILGAENPAEREWVRNVTADANVRLGIEGKVYSAKLVKISNADEINTAKQVLLKKYAEETTAQTDGAWIYRVLSN